MPATPGARVILCSDCLQPIGKLQGGVFHLSTEHGKQAFVPAGAGSGEVPVWCHGCARLGNLNVETVRQSAKLRAFGRVRTRLRWIYESPS